ncbi:hypothetical protein C7974DRAFT_68749 [Boeremia exigua]|uniref:uncharacterized protein n=1 Tax=Boeremia exigua TaxID=749465 RepID=UPI001E8CE128|nr:uncharacterized protein C7974DRAFT_68749 [Boeremia exigua]KAH6614013.1 hypothetical protein C7974DRAFT_68749 [Boeremia exigua]
MQNSQAWPSPGNHTLPMCQARPPHSSRDKHIRNLGCENYRGKSHIAYLNMLRLQMQPADTKLGTDRVASPCVGCLCCTSASQQQRLDHIPMIALHISQSIHVLWFFLHSPMWGPTATEITPIMGNKSSSVSFIVVYTNVKIGNYGKLREKRKPTESLKRSFASREGVIPYSYNSSSTSSQFGHVVTASYKKVVHKSASIGAESSTQRVNTLLRPG